ncbi:MAG: twin-arginine translocation signal domain-containing protein [Planctomycetota bacterium]
MKKNKIISRRSFLTKSAAAAGIVSCPSHSWAAKAGRNGGNTARA